MELLNGFEPTFWHWWIVGGVMLVLELLAPGVFFLWLAFAAAVTGIIKLVFPGVAVEWQLLLFALLGVISTFAGRRWFVRRINGTDNSGLNQRGAQLTGRVVTLPGDTVNGEVRMKLDGTTWRLFVGEDLKAGSRVRITGLKGIVLQGRAEAE